jgi:predicted cation transporter
MSWQSLYEQWLIPLATVILAIPFAGAFVRRRGLWFDSKLVSVFQDIPLNVILAMIIVVLGLSSIIITPILPLVTLGVIALLFPINSKELAKFLVMGVISIILGTLSAVDLPLSPVTFVRFEGAYYPSTFLEGFGLYAVFGIAAIGLVGLSLLRPDTGIEPKVNNSEI